uniref:Succinate dehydrogenase complex subunit C n=4 Tax=Cercospora TaxID=29002 RepID=A0A7G8KU60_9PEZI|nr:succinate dehydrogenase complex subunit C [Cercospora kikuchii]QNJ46703.1 succinate dehydrogenase complex subunit C [Cercospora sp.]QNJ46705.1 succinate dehydrogenase complex subunit C [Cercospora sp. G JZG-2013]QNJ46707.1 succinate dehydrogenase complex subunit C [Cercospora nicotianae]QNJ46704.1 succinate dehydrogenase complex subunit C [Cercospora kikuchii]
MASIQKLTRPRLIEQTFQHVSRGTAKVTRRLVNHSSPRKVQFEVIQDKTHHLTSQRLKRPVSPHLSIYQPQINSFLSISMRITGTFLSGGLYLFSCLYLLSPTFGIDMSSEHLASVFGSWPTGAQIAAKLFVAFPMSLHFFGSLRNMVQVMGKGVAGSRSMVRMGWVTVGVSAATAVGLAGWV